MHHLSAACLVLVLASLRVAAAQESDVRVMSFNIRYGTAADGENHWDQRREFLLETITRYSPDLLGTQETLGFQRDVLAKHLRDHEVLGVGRDDGRERGEMMAVYWRRDRLEKLDSGHFWLSETPDEVGSKSWDSSLPRMVTWVRLRDKRRPAASPLLFLNTHFDHRGETARLESARLLRRRVAELGEGCSIVVTGDFNCDEDSPPYKALFDDRDGTSSPLLDAFRAATPDKGPREGTFSGFRADSVEGPRIDWIGVSRDWKIVTAEIDRTSRDGRTPSDHFPVTAILRR